MARISLTPDNTNAPAPSRQAFDDLRAKINERSAVAAVIGLGYVGLPLVRHLCNTGYTTIGFDTDQSKIGILEQGKSYIKHIESEWVAQTINSGKFTATADFSQLGRADCISICVPTPLNEHREPDLQYVRATAEAIAQHLRPGQLVILESTTYPGTTVEVLKPILDRAGLIVGQDYFLAYSPEREDPGNPVHTINTIPKVIGGVTKDSTALVSDYYGKIFDKVIPVSSPDVAELAKLLENIFRSVNIALVNELKMLCDRMNINVWEVIDAAASKPFGFMPFYPGPGLGGHCIPIDPFYLSWKAREYDFEARFITLAGEINTAMPHYVVTKLMEALNENAQAVQGAKILVLGIAYKQDVDDPRESPAIKLIELLQERGAQVAYHDPHIPKIAPGRKYDLGLESITLSDTALAEFDCVLIATAHSAYDFDNIAKHAKLIVDTRNACKDVTDPRARIVNA